MGFFLFTDAADDVAFYPFERLLSITCAHNTQIKMNFESSVGKSDGGDTVLLTITAGKEVAIMNSIISNMNSNIVIADDVNSIYVHPDITACAITLDT